MQQHRQWPELRHALGRRRARSLIARLVARGDNILAFPIWRVTFDYETAQPGVQATVVSLSCRRPRVGQTGFDRGKP